MATTRKHRTGGKKQPAKRPASYLSAPHGLTTYTGTARTIRQYLTEQNLTLRVKALPRGQYRALLADQFIGYWKGSGRSALSAARAAIRKHDRHILFHVFDVRRRFEPEPKASRPTAQRPRKARSTS